MQNVNLISDGTVTVLAKKLPFKNNFVQRNFVRTERTRNGRDAIVADVVCTQDSGEPGRVYTVCYTLGGTMMWCVC